MFLLLVVCRSTSPGDMYQEYSSYMSTLVTVCETAFLTTHTTLLRMQLESRREFATYVLDALRANESVDQLSAVLEGLPRTDLLWICNDIKHSMTTGVLETLRERAVAIKPRGVELLSRYVREGKEAQAIFERELNTVQQLSGFYESELQWMLSLADTLSQISGSATHPVPRPEVLVESIVNARSDSIALAKKFTAAAYRLIERGTDPVALAYSVRGARQILIGRSRDRFDYFIQAAQKELRIADDARHLYKPDLEGISRELKEIRDITSQLSLRLTSYTNGD